MKNLIKMAVCLIAFCALLTSCSKVIRSHRDFMDDLKTKTDLVRVFGYPFQYTETSDTTKWLYNLTEQKQTTQSNPNPIRTSNTFSNSKKVEKFDTIDKYLEVTFLDDSVISSNVSGIKYTIRKPQTLKTVLLVGAILAGTGIAIFLLSYDTDWLQGVTIF